MKKRIVLNAFYTIGIVISVVGIKWAYQNANYPIVALLVATGIFFLYLKINIVKEVKTDLRTKEEQYKSSVIEEKNLPAKEVANLPVKEGTSISGKEETPVHLQKETVPVVKEETK